LLRVAHGFLEAPDGFFTASYALRRLARGFFTATRELRRIAHRFFRASLYLRPVTIVLFFDLFSYNLWSFFYFFGLFKRAWIYYWKQV